MPPIDAIADAPNACQVLPNLVTSGQPTEAQLRAAHAAGVRFVLDVRDPMEPRPFDEPALCRELGLEYLNIPITGPTMTVANLQKILDAVRAHLDQPVYFHCASGARVGAALLPLLVLDHGFTTEDAVDQAVRIGVRNPDYLQWSFGYLESQGRA